MLTPFAESLVQPASYELTLGDEFVRNRHPTGTVRTTIGHEGDSLWMEPGDFFLATTIETVTLPGDLTAQVRGKSSWMRNGLQVCSDAGYVDPGFRGQITLELKNLGDRPLELRYGVRIAQLVFVQMTSSAEFPYGHEKVGSHYQGQQGTTASWMKNS